MLNAHLTVRDNWPLVSGNPIPYLNCLRDSKSPRVAQRPGRIAWPRGKYPFAAFAAAHGGRVPETIAFIEEGRVTHGTMGADTTVAAFLEALPSGHYFCKPGKGGNGIGAFRLEIAGGEALVDGEARSLQAVARLLTAKKQYVVQPSLTALQHPDIARFNAHTINTFRLITFDAPDGPKAIAGALRIATTSEAVDNWSAGGVMVPVDLANEALGKFGIIKENLKAVNAHPVSGLTFRGQKIPHFRAAIAMTTALHRKLDMGSVGWDIALLKDGICLLEGNRQWDTHFAAQLNPAFLGAFLDFHLEPGNECARIELNGHFPDADAIRFWLSGMIGSARASGKVLHLSNTNLVFALSGPAIAINMVLHFVKQSAAQLRIANRLATPHKEAIPPGLDIAATFSK